MEERDKTQEVSQDVGRLRNEAAVIPSREGLTDDQKRAGDDVYALIAEMAASPETASSDSAEDAPDFLPRTDPLRKSRVVLIDGGRGSGKTALLVTLLDVWRKTYTRQSIPEGLERWAQPEGSIIPVGHLDLHPLPRSTNLLLHVVSRLERVVEWIEGREGGDEGAAWDLLAVEEKGARKHWQKLLRTVASGWDGNAEERAGKLDLEAYAVELEDAERQRLDLRSCFVAFMNALEKDFRKRRGMKSAAPLVFVLAVDDADMNPRRSVDLLDMLRMLWHPRLAFLLTGDSELFQQTLRAHVFDELRAPLRGHSFLKDELADIVGGRHRNQLAADIYEKVIPPGHRCALPPLAAMQRATTSLDVKTGATLLDALGRVKVEPGAGTSMAEYFRKDEQVCEALPDRLRGLIDLAGEVRRLVGVEKRPEAWASRVVQMLWRDAVQAFPALREDLEDAVSIHDGGALEIKLPQPPEIEVGRSHVTAQMKGDVIVVTARWPKRFDLTTKLDHFTRFPRSVVASLLLAVNVATDQERGVCIFEPSKLSGYEGWFIASSFQKNGKSMAHFAWPLPTKLSLAHVMAFASRWRAEVDEVRKGAVSKGEVGKGEVRKDEVNKPVSLSQDQVDELGQRFLRLVAYVFQPFDPFKPLHDIALDWETLADQVIQLTHLGATRHSEEARNWARARAWLMAAPESGLSKRAAEMWLEAMKRHLGQDKDVWEKFRLSLCEERRRRAEIAGNTGLQERKTEDLVGEISKVFADHPWTLDVENIVPPGAQPTPPAAPAPAAPAPPARGSAPAAAQLPAPAGATAQTAGPPLEIVPKLKALLDDLGLHMRIDREATKKLNMVPPEHMEALIQKLEQGKRPAGSEAEIMVAVWKHGAEVVGQGDLSAVLSVKDDKVEVRTKREDLPIVPPLLDALYELSVEYQRERPPSERA